MVLRFSLRTWLLIFHLVVLALPLLTLAGTGAIARMLQEQARTHLVHEAGILAATGPLPAPTLARIEETTGIRAYYLDPSRRIRAAADPTEVGQVLEVPPQDVQVAPCAGLVTCTGDLLRVAVRQPMEQGMVVLSQAPPPTLQAVFHVGRRFFAATLLALAATCALALTSGHLLSRSLRSLARTARHLGSEGSPALERPSHSHVSEVAALSGALQDMARRLGARLAYIREFASGVAHEFRTPITTLRGTLELLRDDPDMPGEQRARFLENGLAALSRLDRLVGGLLALARAEEQGERRPVDLDALLVRLQEMWPQLQVRGQAGTVQGDPVQLETALRNLVENGWVHGGPGARVQVEAGRDGPTATLDVVDDGPGISEANLPRVFDRFFTTGRVHGCVGLGLSLVRAIARGHGGDVTVERREGETWFRMRVG